MWISRDLAEILEARVLVVDVAAHREVGAIELDDGAGRGDRLVLVLHRVGDGEDVGLVAWVVLVLEEERDDAGRGGGGEHLRAAGGGGGLP